MKKFIYTVIIATVFLTATAPSYAALQCSCQGIFCCCVGEIQK